MSHAKILVIGVAYKKDIDDIRESPALVIIELLIARQTAVDYHDPYVRKIPKTRAHAALAGMQSVSLDRATVASYDAVLIVTDHADIDWQLLVDEAQIIVDTRNACAKTTGGGSKVFIA